MLCRSVLQFTEFTAGQHCWRPPSSSSPESYISPSLAWKLASMQESSRWILTRFLHVLWPICVITPLKGSCSWLLLGSQEQWHWSVLFKGHQETSVQELTPPPPLLLLNSQHTYTQTHTHTHPGTYKHISFYMLVCAYTHTQTQTDTHINTHNFEIKKVPVVCTCL